jgi:tetratricopeptide (TPR) repeat protein
LELKNDRPEFYADYVAVCIKQGDMEEAGRWIDLGLKEFPDHATLLNGQGYLYFLQGKYADAKKHYVRALAQNPDNLAVLENLALLYATVHDVAKSREYLRRILKIEPGHVKAKKALGA